MDTLPLGTAAAMHLESSDADTTTRVMVGGAYRLLRVIGRGSGGSVFEARHEPTGTRVAVKVLHARLKKSEQQHLRFEREVRTVASLRHPNIVRLLDAGVEEDGTPWQVLELLEGQDLASALEERPFLLDEAVEVMLQLLDALDAVHARGYVHRDIKPENIFLEGLSGGPVGVKLLDFGIAKPLMPTTLQPWITENGVLLGTPQFMAPEQITGELPVTPAADVWAAGAVFFYMLAGRAPFEEPLLSRLLTKIAREPAPSLSLFCPHLSLDFVSIVARALRTHPAHRFGSAAEMRLAITGCISGVHVL